MNVQPGIHLVIGIDNAIPGDPRSDSGAIEESTEKIAADYYPGSPALTDHENYPPEFMFHCYIQENDNEVLSRMIYNVTGQHECRYPGIVGMEIDSVYAYDSEPYLIKMVVMQLSTHIMADYLAKPGYKVLSTVPERLFGVDLDVAEQWFYNARRLLKLAGWDVDASDIKAMLVWDWS